MNRRIAVLQTAALPLGYAAKKMERETGFEPATSTLARSHSTTELFPLIWFAFSNGIWIVCQYKINSFHEFIEHDLVAIKNSLYRRSTTVSSQEMPGPDKIICSRPNRKYKRAPQKKGSDGVHADREIIIMEK